jgi:LuxR family maltose regulon positive regulatory protein
VPRPRLVERLRAGLQSDRQLILVSAAAGFGKTTLASEWIAGGHLSGAVAWISLDREDNNPTRFLFYLISSMQQVIPSLGENIVPILQSPQPHQLNELLEQLLNQIADSKKQVLLFLDDYHLITSNAVHHIVQRTIEQQPANMHVIILTREDPPLPLPRMRVRGQMIEVRERDLRFTMPEAQEFLLESMGLNLSGDEVEKLKERTEGWAAGMQLAALALEDYVGEEDRRNFIDVFAGSDRYIVDYLVSEVLNHQSGAICEFLLNTSILDRFCADLCDQVVYGNPLEGKSQQMLDRLEKGNMFLVPLDNQRQWYRYHHLFAEMLKHSLNRDAPGQIPDLYHRATDWFETRGYISEAIKYALQFSSSTGDWDFSSRLIDEYAMRMIFQGQGNLVINWCKSFPRSYLINAAEISIYNAWALVLTFRTDYLEAVEEKLQWAIQSIEATDSSDQEHVEQDGSLVSLRDWVTGHVCVIQSQLLLGRFHTYVDPQELISLSLTSLDLLPQSEKAIRAICKINLAHAQLMQNDPEEARKAFDETLPFMLEANNYLGGVTCIFYKARLSYYLGQLDHAEMLCRTWREQFVMMAGSSSVDIPAIRGLDIVLSMLLLERGQVEDAENLLAKALDLPGWASWMEFVGFIHLARLRFLRGNHEGADEVLGRMANMGLQFASCAQALRNLFAIQSAPNDYEVRSRAEKWGDTLAPDLDAPIALGIGPYHCDVEYFSNLLWVQIQIALGHTDEALAFVEPALTLANDHHLVFRVLELTLILALVQEASGSLNNALVELEKAMNTAERYGYIRIFAESPQIRRLLMKYVEGNPHNHFAKQLLLSTRQLLDRQQEGISSLQKGIDQPVLRGSTAAGRPPLVELLSERELEVLQLIADGLSNAQIAERLYIAQGTVKRHITNIYGKLTVQSRTQAIAKAREVGLL